MSSEQAVEHIMEGTNSYSKARGTLAMLLRVWGKPILEGCSVQAKPTVYCNNLARDSTSSKPFISFCFVVSINHYSSFLVVNANFICFCFVVSVNYFAPSLLLAHTTSAPPLL